LICFDSIVVWVDWNNDGFFNNTSDVVYSKDNVQNGVYNGSFRIPATTPAGNYRLRVMLLSSYKTYVSGGIRYNSGSIPNCEDKDSFAGETEDYNLVIVNSGPCDTPTALNVSNITSSSAALSWQSTGDSFDVEWGEKGFTKGQGKIINDIKGNSYILNSLKNNTDYEFYVRQNCSSEKSDWSAPFGFSLSGSLSTSDISKKEITLYPNPVKDILYFSNEVSDIKISDLSGRVIKQIYTKEKSINIEDLASGVYIITGKTEGVKTITKKIIKQ